MSNTTSKDDFKTEFDRLVQAFSRNMQDADFLAGKIGIYFEALHCLPLYGIKYAIKKALINCRYFPTIAELFQLAMRSREGIPRGGWAEDAS